MKSSSALLALSAIGSTFAAPTSEKELVSPDQSPHLAGLTEEHLARRDLSSTCQAAKRVLYSVHGTLEVLNFAQSTASPYIKNICDRHGNSDCGVWLADIEDGFQLILSLTRPIAGGTIAVDATGRLDINSRDAAQTIASAEWDIEKALGLMNYTFESHELVPNPNIGIKLNNDTPAMTHHHRLAGVQHSESTVPRDYNLYRYNDGAAQLHLSPASLNNSTSTVQKRKAHNGPGIKISFDHRAFGITKSYIKPAANKMADDWLKSVQGNHADTYAKVSEKIKSKWIDIVQYRTILESGGFGENYESVHNCDSKK